MSDPTGFTSGKELVSRQRLVKGEDPEGTDFPQGVFLELWEDRNGRRKWAVALLDDYRAHLGSGIHMKVSDEEAGWLQREFTEADCDE